MSLLAPSILAADVADLRAEIASAEQSGVSLLHLDIMDGHFVPNLSYGPAVVKRINELTDLPLDVHLMLKEPERYVEAFVQSGADSITFHLEVHPDPRPLAARIRGLGKQCGLAINPDLPVERTFPFLAEFDLLLVMSVFPGFGGQPFMPVALEKVRAARSEIQARNLQTRIEIDGGIDMINAREVILAGADILVMGTAFFGAADRSAVVRQVEQPTTDRVS